MITKGGGICLRGRALAAAAAAYIIVSFLILTIWPLPLYNDNTLEGGATVVYGTVKTFTYRNEKLQVIIDRVTFSGDQKFQKRQLNSKRASGLGAICYLDANAKPPRVGAFIKISGTFRNIKGAANPGEFDLKRYYQIKGIDFSIVKANILSESKGYDYLGELLLQSRRALENVIDDCLSEDCSGLIKAMLLGDKDALPDKVSDDFTKCGLSHLLCISGTHVGIIGLLIYGLFEKTIRQKYVSTILSVLFMWYYAGLTQMGTATVRAVIMFAVCMLGKMTGRTYDVITALSVAAVSALILNPLLIYDTGFLLSFSAVFSLSVLKELPANLRVTVFSLPLTTSIFNTFPVYSLILNLLLIPPIAILLLTALVTVVFGSIIRGSILCTLAAASCELLCRLYMLICSYFAALPGSILVTGASSLLQIVLFYLMLFILCPYLTRLAAKKIRWRYISKLTKVVYIIPVLILLFHSRSGLTIVAADVGQGDGIAAFTDSHCVLFDGGSSDKKKVGENILIPMLKYYGLTSVDMIFITHVDEDHISGIEEMLEKADSQGISLRAIAMSDNSLKSEKGIKIRNTASKKGIKVYELKSGDEITYGRLKLECIYPEHGAYGDTNELSLTVRLTYGDFSAFLCGDLEGVGETKMIEEIKPESVTLYKAAHHGSGGTGSEALLKLLKPKVSVISCGENNKYGHPHEETLSRLRAVGSKLYITKDSGAVIFKTDGKNLRIQEFNR